MSMTDPIADMLTRIRNANIARHDKVDIPASRLRDEIARILMEEGYIKSYRLMDVENKKVLRLYLKYSRDKQRVISGLRRVSKPGRRVYMNKKELPRIIGGFGTAIVSTSHGIMTAVQSRKEGFGGEILCYIW
ncbi:30S ribosomal protein S8 [Candidatus Poribacteria bacterium]|nr:30S ribosomal protein S8 [Candidatus Poribacteria bacterium]